MEVLFNKVIKLKVIELIKSYTDDSITELILDFPLSDGTFHSIEIIKMTNEVLLHTFDFDFDYSIPFDDLNQDDKLRIFQILKGIKHLD
jgi:hypothetical protein